MAVTDRVLVAGTFDLFHPGHVRLLRRAALLGPVWAAVNPCEFAARYKRRPIMTFAERFETVAACRFVTHVIEGPDGPLTPLVRTVRPRYIAHGSDWGPDAYLEQIGATAAELAGLGAVVVSFPYTEEVTTSMLIARCKSG